MASGDNTETLESFTTMMNDMVFSGFKFAGIALGEKLGLFQAFDETMTSEELAAKCDYKERYVREWLRHMVMCDIVNVDESGTKFSLPDHRRQALLSDTNMMKFIGPAFPAMFAPHQEILECFKNDGPIGLPFEKVYPFFGERALLNQKSLALSAEFIRDNVPGLKEQLDTGIKVCDIGSGNGAMLLHLAGLFPKSNFIGFDLSTDLMKKANDALKKSNLQNIEFLLQDASQLPEIWNNTFDTVILRDVLHDISHVSKALKAFHRVMKPGGKIVILELNLSSNPYKSLNNPKQKQIGILAYVISTYHCLPASLVVPGSAGLGAGSGIEHITRLLEDAGFTLGKDFPPADFFNVLFIGQKT